MNYFVVVDVEKKPEVGNPTLVATSAVRSKTLTNPTPAVPRRNSTHWPLTLLAGRMLVSLS
jgi:hypothetical protein